MMEQGGDGEASSSRGTNDRGSHGVTHAGRGEENEKEEVQEGEKMVMDKTKKKKKKKKRFMFFKRFTYQQLRGWRPVLSPLGVEVFFVVTGTILLALGIAILVASLNVVEYKVRYDDAGTLVNTSNEDREKAVTAGNGVSYIMQLLVEEDMKAPVRGCREGMGVVVVVDHARRHMTLRAHESFCFLISLRVRVCV